ncbi:hypothetical protein AB0J86_05025 [Micromonospora sp. NPDC049559]|uniref:hypothetical protein n=1 Tax=Micromonospora sp. NPDC049559 TaxID=3155923 RepID=UPI003430A1AA
MTGSPDDAERQILDLTDGDAGLARLLHASLRRLHEGAAGDDLQEMAREVLAGRSSLREIAATDAYGSMFVDHFRQFSEWQRTLDPQERERLAAEAAEAATSLNQDT